MARYKTIREAARAWVNEFSAIPSGVCEKLLRANCEELTEVTPPSVGDRAYVYDESADGEVIRYYAGTGKYRIRLDWHDLEIELEEEDFEVKRDDALPMWGTLWAFGSQLDNDWLEHGGLRAMADCGFRVYEQEDYEYIFGIDGAGYDFYDEHWIPLYKARGLQWHETEGAAA